MLIDAIELREISLPLLHPFETSLGRTSERHILLVCVTDPLKGNLRGLV
jgi:hypothetical protein